MNKKIAATTLALILGVTTLGIVNASYYENEDMEREYSHTNEMRESRHENERYEFRKNENYEMEGIEMETMTQEKYDMLREIVLKYDKVEDFKNAMKQKHAEMKDNMKMDMDGDMDKNDDMKKDHMERKEKHENNYMDDDNIAEKSQKKIERGDRFKKFIERMRLKFNR